MSDAYLDVVADFASLLQQRMTQPWSPRCSEVIVNQPVGQDEASFFAEILGLWLSAVLNSRRAGFRRQIIFAVTCVVPHPERIFDANAGALDDQKVAFGVFLSHSCRVSMTQKRLLHVELRNCLVRMISSSKCAGRQSENLIGFERSLTSSAVN